MKKHFLAIAFLAATLFAFAPAFSTANAAQGTSITRVTALPTTPITGSFTGGTFAGNFSVTRFVSQGGQLLAVGTLTGTLTDALGNAIGTISQLVKMPVSSASGSCQILNLDLGPLDLNLLGLQVHLNEVVLNITAQSGSGQLLGNLLCAVANLLNGGNPLTSLTSLLNRILGQL